MPPFRYRNNSPDIDNPTATPYVRVAWDLAVPDDDPLPTTAVQSATDCHAKDRPAHYELDSTSSVWSWFSLFLSGQPWLRMSGILLGPLPRS